MEIEYVFAINPDAAFTDLDILIGDKTVKAVLKEKEEAKAEYDEGVK